MRSGDFLPAVSDRQNVFSCSYVLRRSRHAGIHFRNPRLLSAAFFISQAFGASVSYGCKCAVRGKHSGDFLSAGIFHPQDQCARFPQASAVGTSGTCTVGFSFPGRTEALSAPLFHPYGKYQLFPVPGALLSGNVLRPGGVRLLHPLCNVCHRGDLKCGTEYRAGLPVLDHCGAKILRMAAEETAALSISLVALLLSFDYFMNCICNYSKRCTLFLLTFRTPYSIL